ncbi:hypothetical protein D3N24_15795 [Vibrio vulnificus]|uniref:hypothetical protein n=1 Tax=Vibrio vulnificus TaxID=672 RepID=UPI001CDD3DEC|nr:hypothetical protein [Vibrio vulnificus]EGR1868892.1 hypothetical protein [Vibrio vulnificus]MCA3906929.1 hypothetical protein [Vibrio vulnificus]
MSTDAPEMLLALKEFAPYISVAVALNFVSSFWDAVKNKAVNRFDKNIKYLRLELENVFDGDCESSTTYQSIQQKSDAFRTNLICLSRLSTFVGIVVVIFLFFVLALMGYRPGYEISEVDADWLMFLSVGPTVLFMLIGYIYSFYAMSAIKGKCEDAKNTASDVLRHTIKKAYADDTKNPIV